MTYDERRRRARGITRADQDAAVAALAAAARAADELKTADAEAQVRRAVDAARDAAVGWSRIGDTLGLARGNAYKRYHRRRSSGCEAGNPCQATD